MTQICTRDEFVVLHIRPRLYLHLSHSDSRMHQQCNNFREIVRKRAACQQRREHRAFIPGSLWQPMR